MIGVQKFKQMRIDRVQALLAIELNGVSWDFGKLVWNNIVMVCPPRPHLANFHLTRFQVVNGTQTSWCTEYVYILAPEMDVNWEGY